MNLGNVFSLSYVCCLTVCASEQSGSNEGVSELVSVCY